jgi:UDP-N-acetylmuramyl pentapeptide phosphotransferase/UDP-N-acetylglucosamine-1-phosphate transferase
VAIAAVAFAGSALLTAVLVRARRRFARMLDEPNERSLHKGAIPRTGGMAVLGGILCAGALARVLLGPDGDWAWIAAAAALVAVVSFLDDRGGVRPRYRLGAHVAAAGLLAAGGLGWSYLELPGLTTAFSGPLSVLATVLYVVWMINLYNFMDGMDGFAGGMALFGFGALAVLGWRAGDPGFAAFAGAIAAAAGGFLTRNFPPARIFLGDLGSATLGLMAAAFSLLGSQRGLFPLWAAWIAFSPFIVDATWTLARRLLRGERVWEAHRSHHYQRLVLAGWSHRRTVLRAYLLMLGCAASAVGVTRMSEREQWWVLGAWAIIYLLVHYKTRLVERGAEVAAP